MLSDEIDATGFRKAKDDASEQVVRLEAKLNAVMEHKFEAFEHTTESRKGHFELDNAGSVL
jgi:hypothetical protein